MARHWAPLRDLKVTETRSRSVVRPLPGTGANQWGQRPMFSEPGPDQAPPEDGRIPSEMQPDDINPTDGRESSHEVASEAIVDPVAPVRFTISSLNVSSPPTDAQLTEAFGARSLGEAFIVIDGGSGAVWLVVQAEGGSWWYEALTEAI